MNDMICMQRYAEHIADYDVIVAGGGVAGVAAAVSARRMGKSVLLIEKMVALGGLATTGLVNLFVSMCNGRGKKIIRGMCEELVELSTRYGYDSVFEEWKNGEPTEPTKKRYKTRFSAPIFAMCLTELLKNEGVDMLFDTVITAPIMEERVCRGLVVENKSGCQFYGAKMVIDTTGDADVLERAGVPTVQGQNFDIFTAEGVTLETCQMVLDTKDMRYLTKDFYGGRATLYGKNQPADKPTKGGTTVTDVTNHVIENHLACLAGIKEDDRRSRTLVNLPYMCQFRTTRHIDGDYTMSYADEYRHHDDSVCVCNDFNRRDYLYEIPYRALKHHDFPNLITAGRTAAGEGYLWDVIRVIPPAILTGQAAGVAAALALDGDGNLHHVDIAKLQSVLASQNVMIHFDDALVPQKEADDVIAISDL